MLRFKTTLATSATTLLLSLGVAACGTSEDATTTSTSSQAPVATTTTAAPATGSSGGGPGAAVDVSSVSSADELVGLIQEAYGEASLGLHRGHQDVEETLIDVLGISHDEMHVRMETQGQNLAAVATDLGIEPRTLIDALVETRSPAIDRLLEAGTITQEQADGYLAELEEAYTYRVTWDGQQATPTAKAVS